MTSQASLQRGDLVTRMAFEITSGKLAVGTRLPSERQLAERLKVSRPVVREVLRSLEERGLIEVSPGRGAFVRGLRGADVVGPLDTIYRRQATPRDLVEARLAVETKAAELAAEHATESDLVAMSSALDRFDAADGLIEMARHDVTFHAGIARASANPVIATIFASIATLTFELMLRSLGDEHVARTAVPLHREILAAIEAGDAERARGSMAAHLSVAKAFYGEELDASLESVAQQTLERTYNRRVSMDAVIATALGESRYDEPDLGRLLGAPPGSAER